MIKPELESIPQVEWFNFEPKVDEAKVMAEVSINEYGGITNFKIVSISPSGLPEAPLKAAIQQARFTPMRFKASTSKAWSTSAHKMKYEFTITW
ncbi:hypothetical protein [Simiduia litorea]|uniref:hypothetical protein n=1 Tax=Simiduia litorea TaxID=1435348 RepID=UPI0036F19641